jgi:hypothetical protein
VGAATDVKEAVAGGAEVGAAPSALPAGLKECFSCPA